MKSFLHLRSIRVVTALAIASGFAGTVGLVASTTPVTQAGADPTAATAFVGVGADVTQDLYNAFAGEAPNPGSGVNNVTFYTPLHSSLATNSVTIQSWDANPQGGSTQAPGTITTKKSGPTFDRPSSSGAGTKALDASLNGTNFANSVGSNGSVNVGGQIDFARTAAVPATGGTDLTWLPFARDGLGILVYNNGVVTGPTQITWSDLDTIYTNGTGTDTFDGNTYTACLPLNTASPVKNLASALGLGSNTAPLITAATNAGCNGTITQNNGNSFVAGLPAGTHYAIIPISAGSWIGQANGVAYDRSNIARADGVDLADIVNQSLVDLGQPYTVSGGKEVANDTYDSDSAFGYYISTVAPTAKVDGAFGSNPALENLFVGSTSQICTTGQATVSLFGFDPLPSSTCGSATVIGTGNN